MSEPPIIRLIMRIVGVAREIAEIILGYVPVRRRLTIIPPYFNVDDVVRVTWPRGQGG